MLHNTHPYIPLSIQMFELMREKPPDQQQNIAVKLHMADGADAQ